MPVRRTTKVTSTAFLGLLLAALLAGCAHSPLNDSAMAPKIARATAPSVGRPNVVEGATASAPQPAVADAAAIVRTADIAVEVRRSGDIARQADAAAQIAARAGGTVFSADRSDGPDSAATLVLKVPPAALSGVLSSLGALGDEQYRRLDTRDVTAEVADVSARLTSARASITRLQQLFAQARTVADVLAVETDLASREANLEALEAQQRVLSAQTDLATVTMRLTSAAPPPAPVRHGFAAGLHAGWEALINGLRALATGTGAAIPFAVPLAVLIVLLRFARHRKFARQTSE